MVNMTLRSVRRDAAEHYTWGNGCDGWHLVRQERLSVIEERMPAGTAEVRHYHQSAQQFFYILTGKAVMELDGKIVELGRGEGLHIPPETPHQIRNESEEAV